MRPTFLFALLFLILWAGCADSNKRETMKTTQMEKKPLIAKHYYSGFPLAHDTYNTITAASDGRIYYCLSSQSIDIGGQYYVYDPKSDEIEHLGDITRICGESGTRAIPQGKSHSNFYESRGKLYISTHAGYYEMIDGMEMMVQNPPDGYSLYPGGHILSYDLTTGEFEDLAISWPYGYLGFDLGPDQETMYYLTGGPIYIDGERVKGVDEIAMGAAKGLENLHLVTFHIPTNSYTDHGPIFYEDGSRPTYVNSIAIGMDGAVYTPARFEQEGKEIEDLVKIPNPFGKE